MPRNKHAASQPTSGNGNVAGGTDDAAVLRQLEFEVVALRKALDDCQRQRRALCESDGFYRVILENVSDAVFLTDDHEAFTFICPNCNVIFGYSPAEVSKLGRISALLGTNGRYPSQLINGGMVVNHECEILAKGGNRRTLLVNVKRVSIGGGTRLFVCRDITERKQAEADLRQSEERYRDIVEDQTELICRYLEDGTITFVNSAYAKYFNRSVESLVGTSFWQLIPAESHEAVREFQASITLDRPVSTIEHPVYAPGGKIRWQQWTDHGIFDDQGNVLEYQSVGRDITDRKLAEEDAAAAHAEIQRLTERLEADNIYLRHEVKLKYNYDAIVGRSPAIRRVLRDVEQVAATNSTVLLIGETGTGKELVARAIHSRSSRHERPMVTVNCASLPTSLIESELFGREEGAYTGALSRQIGRFELANGSTLFLDEIGELPLETQVKLLRVLQTGEFERLGSTETRKVDVRIVAATNRDLEQGIRSKVFREDLFYRLNVFPIRVPPLRERLDDIPLLVQSFIQEFGRTMKKVIELVPRSTLESLQLYHWPGNIRELRNVVERAMIVTQGDVLHADVPHLSKKAAAGDANTTAETSSVLTLEDVQRGHIVAVLERTGWRISGPHGAAALLGVKPTTLEYRIAKLGISRPGSTPKELGISQ
jgi:PAS domain S-box-containing protein